MRAPYCKKEKTLLLKIMKILHYTPSIDKNSGGVGAYMQLLTRDLGTMCELHVVTHRTDMMLDLENCFLHFIPLNNNPFSNKSKKEFLSLLEEISPDVFHTNGCWLPQSARTAMWAKKRGYKVVYSPHGMLEPWIMNRHYWTRKLPATLLYQRRAVRLADIVHATAESEKDNLLVLGWNGCVRVIPNCVQIDGIGMKTSWKRRKRLLFLSRVHVKKGIEFLIDAVADLRDELYGYEIVVAGPGEKAYVEKLKKLTYERGVGDMFRFAGSVFGEQKWQMYKEADLFVLPTHSENFGIVVPEALASGTPVITTHGAPWEELNTHKCGAWIPIGANYLADTIKAFLQYDECQLEEMGHNGRKLVEEKYSSESVAKMFIEMYSKIIN